MRALLRWPPASLLSLSKLSDMSKILPQVLGNGAAKSLTKDPVIRGQIAVPSNDMGAYNSAMKCGVWHANLAVAILQYLAKVVCVYVLKIDLNGRRRTPPPPVNLPRNPIKVGCSSLRGHFQQAIEQAWHLGFHGTTICTIPGTTQQVHCRSVKSFPKYQIRRIVLIRITEF